MVDIFKVPVFNRLGIAYKPRTLAEISDSAIRLTTRAFLDARFASWTGGKTQLAVAPVHGTTR